MRIVTFLKDLLPAGLKDSLKKFIPNQFIASFRKGEVVVVSFPKCGRTWLKLLLTDTINNQFPESGKTSDVETERLYRVHSSIPRITFTHDDEPQFKKVEELEIDKSRFKNMDVIFLVRDPRDVIVSWFYEYNNRVSQDYKEQKGLIEKSKEVPDFIYNERGGLKTVIAYFNLWKNIKEMSNSFKIIRYEDLKENTVDTMRDILMFASFDGVIEPQSIQDAVEKNSFANVQKKEKEGKIDVGRRSFEFGHSEPGKNDNLKARRGVVGGYVDYFNKEQIDFMNNLIDSELDTIFGYSSKK